MKAAQEQAGVEKFEDLRDDIEVGRRFIRM